MIFRRIISRWRAYRVVSIVFSLENRLEFFLFFHCDDAKVQSWGKSAKRENSTNGKTCLGSLAASEFYLVSHQQGGPKVKSVKQNNGKELRTRKPKWKNFTLIKKSWISCGIVETTISISHRFHWNVSSRRMWRKSPPNDNILDRKVNLIFKYFILFIRHVY